MTIAAYIRVRRAQSKCQLEKSVIELKWLTNNIIKKNKEKNKYNNSSNRI